MSVHIREVTLRSVYFHCCRHFTHQVDMLIHIMHNVLIINVSSIACNKLECQEGNGNDVTVNDRNVIKIIPENARMNFRMADLQRENWIHGYQNRKQSCLLMDCVYVCFDLTPMLQGTNIFSTILQIIACCRTVSKIPISDIWFQLVWPPLRLSVRIQQILLEMNGYFKILYTWIFQNLSI